MLADLFVQFQTLGDDSLEPSSIVLVVKRPEGAHQSRDMLGPLFDKFLMNFNSSLPFEPHSLEE